MVLLNKNSKKKVYQILREIKGLNKSNANYICKKLGFQKTCNLSNLENEDLEQLKNYLVSAPSNVNKSLGSVTKGILINYKGVEDYDEGMYSLPPDGVTFEVWELKNSKFIDITKKYKI